MNNESISITAMTPEMVYDLDVAITLLERAVADETEFYKRRELAGRARCVLVRLRDEIKTQNQERSDSGFARDGENLRGDWPVR